MRVRVGRLGLAVADTGTGQPVLLLHGLASTHRWWDLVVPRLAGYRVVRFDHRGHGESDAPPSGYRIDRLAADALGLLDALGLHRAVLAGHSLGAAVALRIAAAAPDRVSALACIEGGVYHPHLLFGTGWEQARPRMTRPRRGRVTEAVLRAWLAGSDLPAQALPAIMANYSASGPDGALRLRLAARHEEELALDLWRQDPGGLTPGVRAPAVVLAARQGDRHQDGARRDSIHAARLALGERLAVRWSPGGHELPLQRPAAVAQAIIQVARRAADLERAGQISATWR
jgi:pimeloyl-ACP methyl ester carboxylesterase